MTVLALLVVSLAGCMGPPDDTARTDRRLWRAEAEAHGPMGKEASFDIRGDPLEWTGVGTTQDPLSRATLLPGPLFPSRALYVWFADARVEGESEPGYLLVEGERLTLEGGTLTEISLQAATAGQTVRLALGEDLERAPSWLPEPEGWERPNAFFAKGNDINITDSTLSGHERAILLSSANRTRDVPLSSVRLSASGIYWAQEARIEVPGLVRIAASRLMVGGDGITGTLQISDRDDVRGPQAIAGHDATLAVSPGAMTTEGTFRVTQAIASDRPVLDSRLEILPHRTHVTVIQNETEWVGVSYREASYVGDGLLEDIEVTGSAADFVQVPVEMPPLWVQAMWDAVGETGMAAPFVAIAAAIASPFVLLAEALACIFGFCPQHHPFPSWLEAGDVGFFFIRVQGDVEPGTYEALIRIEGQNYPAVQIPLTIQVATSPEPEGDGKEG